MPTTVDRVQTFLGLSPARPVDDGALADAVASANDAIWAYRPDLDDPAGQDAAWPPRIDGAATIQAARYYGRRGSIQGVAAFQDTGTSFIPRLDPDVAVMCELGPYQPSVVA